MPNMKQVARRVGQGAGGEDFGRLDDRPGAVSGAVSCW